MNFQKVFTRESNFDPPQRESHGAGIWKTRVNKEELLELLKNLDKRKYYVRVRKEKERKYEKT